MAVLQKESDVCTGRGFASVNVNGLLAKFYTWITKAPGAGGPGWFIISDHSTDTDPYIVVSDIAAPGVNDYNTGANGGAPKVMKVGYVNTESGNIRVSSYLGFDGADPVGKANEVFIATYDAGSFNYYFKGGDIFMSITTYDGTSLHGFACLGEWVADLNMEDPATNITTLTSGFSGVTTTEATVLVGDTTFFEVDKYYYITDSRTSAKVDYVKCTAINTPGSTVTITRQSDNNNNWSDADYGAGSLLGSYPHRYYLYGRDYVTNYSLSADHNFNIPYVAYVGTGNKHKLFEPVTTSSTTDENPFCIMAYHSAMLEKTTVAQAAYLGRERSSWVQEDLLKDVHGVPTNMYINNTTGMDAMANGNTIGGSNYLYHTGTSTTSQIAVMLLDDVSAV